jgi:hypothetical protein
VDDEKNNEEPWQEDRQRHQARDTQTVSRSYAFARRLKIDIFPKSEKRKN